MEFGLIQAQVQKQILSPQMIQSMEILVLNSQQLEERIDEALEENIALEVEEPDRDDSDAGTKEVDPGAAQAANDAHEAASEEFGGDSEVREMDLLEDRYEHLAEFQSEQFYNAPGGGRATGGGVDGEDDKTEALQNAADRPATLHDHLMAQLHLIADLTPRQVLYGAEVIYSLDPRGRLLYSLEEMHQSLLEAAANLKAATNGNGADAISDSELPLHVALDPPPALEELEEALATVRLLDPAGIGANSIEECLLLQLDRDPLDYPLERELIENHLADIAKNRLPQIAKATGQSIEDVKNAIEIIASLNPNPGRGFVTEETHVVRPDVFVDEDEGVYKVRVENPHIPRLRISPYYRTLFKEARNDPELRKYIKKKIDNAEWLLHAIHQRKSTLQRVAEEIVQHQQDYFHKGIRYLKPLKMQEIADIIGVNVSTVSRAISGKYMQYPGGVKELKFLFTGGTTKDDGSVESRGSVIERIKKLIDEENKRKPLSDSQIVKLLAETGIHISRRTVTKYREAESILSSRERREY